MILAHFLQNIFVIQSMQFLRSISLFVIVFLFALCAQGQVESSIRKHDYGSIERTSDRVVDVQFTNRGSAKAFPLRTDVPVEFSYLWSGREVAPDSTLTLRLKYHPRKKGTLNETIQVFFSSMQEPISIKIKGEVEYVDRSENIACPSFRERPNDCCGEDAFTVKVIDKVTRKPIKDARVRVIEQGRLQRDVRTDREGIYTEPIPIGYYFLVADKEDYLGADTSSYVNRRNNYFELELTKMEAEPEPLEEIAVVQQEPKQQEEEQEQEQEEIAVVLEPIAEEIVVTSEELPEDQYARNSIIFLVDVSQSMNQKGKLDLLKASMLQLTDALRPIDQVALISYASRSEVILNVTSGDRKAAMEGAIQQLEAGGMTSGAKGFQSAYKLAQDHFIPGGNNQVIVATDGAFTKADQPRIEKMARKFRRSKVKTTVIGIRSNNYASNNLRKICGEGDGSFVFIDNYDSGLNALLEEIRKQSYLGR